MGEHPNATRAREAFDVFARSDLEGYKDYFAEDVVWHVGGRHPLSGNYRGRDALFDYFAKVRDLTGGTLTVEPQAILADDTHVGVFARVTAERDGRSMDVLLAQGFRINPEGKWIEYWALADDQEEVDALWS